MKLPILLSDWTRWMSRSEINVAKISAAIMVGAGVVIVFSEGKKQKNLAEEVEQCISEIQQEKERVRQLLQERQAGET